MPCPSQCDISICTVYITRQRQKISSALAPSLRRLDGGGGNGVVNGADECAGEAVGGGAGSGAE